MMQNDIPNPPQRDWGQLEQYQGVGLFYALFSHVLAEADYETRRCCLWDKSPDVARWFDTVKPTRRRAVRTRKAWNAMRRALRHKHSRRVRAAVKFKTKHGL